MEKERTTQKSEVSTMDSQIKQSVLGFPNSKVLRSKYKFKIYNA